jgi:hypothetical protein
VRGWRLQLHSTYSLDELARCVNPVVAGWMNYYRRFYKTALYPLLRRLNSYLVRWAPQKVQTVAQNHQGQGVVETGYETRSVAVPAMALDSLFLVIRMTRTV